MTNPDIDGISEDDVENTENVLTGRGNSYQCSGRLGSYTNEHSLSVPLQKRDDIVITPRRS